MDGVSHYAIIRAEYPSNEMLTCFRFTEEQGIKGYIRGPGCATPDYILIKEFLRSSSKPSRADSIIHRLISLHCAFPLTTWLDVNRRFTVLQRSINRCRGSEHHMTNYCQLAKHDNRAQWQRSDGDPDGRPERPIPQLSISSQRCYSLLGSNCSFCSFCSDFP